ncbi:MAG: urocanate hydratase, partial [Crocinitomicaceae bacterium]
MSSQAFKDEILQGVPNEIPNKKPYDDSVNHAPKRKEILSLAEKKLAVQNALRYFPKEHHKELAKDFLEELKLYGRIYMYRYRPEYKMFARPIEDYPGKSQQAKAIMLMIQNNLDYAVA